MEDILLEAENLKKVYASRRHTTVISGISFSLERGKTLGIVGQSGSGKTTVAKMIAGMTDRSDGQIILQGHELKSRRSRQEKKDIQYVFQDPYSSLDPMMTVYAILKEPLTLYFSLSEEERRKRIDELLQSVGLSAEIKNKRPPELSGGQCQRVCIARALAAEPLLIICDEPTSALDVTIQKQILELLKQIQRERGISYIFISHSLDVVYSISHTVMVMKKGCIVEMGSTEELFLSPKTEYTRELLEAIPRIQ